MPDEEQPEQPSVQFPDSTSSIAPQTQPSEPSVAQPLESPGQEPPVIQAELASQESAESASAHKEVLEPPVIETESGMPADIAAQPSKEVLEPVATETTQPIPETSAVPAQPQPLQATQESFSNSRELENKTSGEETAQSPSPQLEQHERIMERVRDLNESEKQALFRDRIKSLSPKGVSARRTKRQANYDKIIVHLNVKGFITNNDVEKLCRVKDRTASQYLHDLERQGTILQLGKTGRIVRYRLTQGITL